MHISLVLVCYVCYCLCTLTSLAALDVSFLPNDENAPLPLSAKYRDALRRLCVLLEENRTLPKDVEMKKPVLRQLCKKLKADDVNIAQGIQEHRHNHHVIQSMVYLAITIGSGYLIYTQREVVMMIWKKIYWTLLSVFSAKKARTAGDRGGQVLGGGGGGAADIVAMDETVHGGIGYDVQTAREARLRKFATSSSSSSATAASAAVNPSGI